MDIDGWYVDGDRVHEQDFHEMLEEVTLMIGGAFVSYVRHRDGSVTAEIMDHERIRVLMPAKVHVVPDA